MSAQRRIMIKPQTLKGYWWNPSHPERKCFGVLEYSSEGIELACHAESADMRILDNTSPATVHGLDEKGRPISLLYTDSCGGTRSASMATQRVRSAYALIGIHAADKHSFRSEKVFLRLQHLDGWLGMTGFNRQLNGRISADQSFDVTIQYSRPSEQTHNVQDGMAIAFGINSAYNAAMQEQRIWEYAYACISRGRGFTFDEAWEMASHLRSILHLASLRPVYMVEMELQQCSQISGESTNTSRNVSVWSRNLREAHSMDEWESRWVFRYPQLSNNFGLTFKRWVEFQNKYQEAMDCYISTVYHRLPESVCHLCLTQALDAYHGVRYDSHDKHNFKPKIAELIEKHKHALGNLDCSKDDFPERVWITRNYYTHHNPKWLQTGKVAQGMDLIRMDEQLRILFQTCLILEMELPIECCNALRCQIAKKIIEY